MKCKSLLLLFSALILPLTARAQPVAQPSPQQPAKPSSSLEDDPQFKRLSPEQQDTVRKAMSSIDNAVAAERKSAATPAGAKPQTAAPPAPATCDASPVKKPRFHIPKAMQDAITNQAKQVGNKTGVDVDANAPGKAVKNVQAKLPPCTLAATPAKK